MFCLICSHFLFSSQSLLEAHDMVASKCYEAPPPPEVTNDAAINSALMQADAVRMIGIRKKAGEPLVCMQQNHFIFTSLNIHFTFICYPLAQGVTFRMDKGDLVIARILHGGLIDRQGLLHVGDIIKEVNGKDVGNNPTELQEMLKECSGGITLKILPSYRDAPAPPQVHTRYFYRNIFDTSKPVQFCAYPHIRQTSSGLHLAICEIP